MKSALDVEDQSTRNDRSLSSTALAVRGHGEEVAVSHEDVGPVEEPTAREAWLQVILCHLINFNSFGYILSFGKDNLHV